MKKLLLALGAVTSVAAPVAAVVACSSDTDGGTLTTTETSTLTTAKLGLITQAQIDGLTAKNVSDLNTLFGITSGAPVDNGIAEGTTYVDGKLTFKAGPLGEETIYVITITPKDAPKTSGGTTPGNAGAQAAAVAGTSATDAVVTTSTISDGVDNDEVATLNIKVSDTDYQPQLDAAASKVLHTKLGSAHLDDILKVRVVAEIGAKKIESIATVEKTSSTYANLNKAINAATLKIAAAKDLVGRDISMKAAEYKVSLQNAFASLSGSIDGANQILEALGNGTRFTALDTVTLVSGKSSKFAGTVIKDNLHYLLDKGLLGTFSPDIKTLITNAIDGLSETA